MADEVTEKTEVTERLFVAPEARAPAPPPDLVSVLMDALGAPVVVLDREGRVARFNRAAEELSGWSAAEVRGRPLWEKLLPSEEVDGFRIACEQVLAGRYPLRHEHHWLARDGSRRLVSWSLSGLVDQGGGVGCIVATGQDVTELRAEQEAQNALAASELLFRSVAASVPSAILVTDHAARIVMANGPAQEWLGLPLSSVGTPLGQWLPQAAVFTQGVARGEVEVDAADGRRRLVGFHTERIDLADGPGHIVVFRDITGFRRAEKRRRRAERLAQARWLTAGIGELLQGPLASALSGLQLLEKEPGLRPEHQAVLASVSQEARKLSRIAQEFLEAARMPSPCPRLVALGRAMGDAMDPWVGTAAARGVKLIIVPGSSELLLAVDMVLFRRAIGAMVESAINAAGHGGRVRVEWNDLAPEEVQQRLPGMPGTPGGVVVVRISDDGPEVPRDDLPKLFRPFGSPRAGSCGLGLAVAQEIIEAHGGLISVASRKHEGTTIEVLLAGGDRLPCWQIEPVSGGECASCEVRKSGSGYCCWAVIGRDYHAETGQWPQGCVECPVFRIYNLWSYAGGFPEAGGA